MSFGALIGAQSVDSILILNTEDAVKSVSGAANLKLGTDIGVAVGPVGREANASIALGKAVAPIYAYSHSRGK